MRNINNNIVLIIISFLIYYANCKNLATLNIFDCICCNKFLDASIRFYTKFPENIVFQIGI